MFHSGDSFGKTIGDAAVEQKVICHLCPAELRCDPMIDHQIHFFKLIARMSVSVCQPLRILIENRCHLMVMRITFIQTGICGSLRSFSHLHDRLVVFNVFFTPFRKLAGNILIAGKVLLFVKTSVSGQRSYVICTWKRTLRCVFLCV